MTQLTTIILDQDFRSELLKSKISGLTWKQKEFLMTTLLGGDNFKQNVWKLDTRRDWNFILQYFREHNSCHNPFYSFPFDSLGFKFTSLRGYNQEIYNLATRLGEELVNDCNFLLKVVAISPKFLDNTNER